MLPDFVSEVRVLNLITEASALAIVAAKLIESLKEGVENSGLTPNEQSEVKAILESMEIPVLGLTIWGKRNRNSVIWREASRLQSAHTTGRSAR